MDQLTDSFCSLNHELVKQEPVKKKIGSAVTYLSLVCRYNTELFFLSLVYRYNLDLLFFILSRLTLQNVG